MIGLIMLNEDVRKALGKHNDDNEPIPYLVAGLVAEVERLSTDLHWLKESSLECRRAFGKEVKPVYLYRRKGLDDFSTCSHERYIELAVNPLFETSILYPNPPPEMALLTDAAIDAVIRHLEDGVDSNTAFPEFEDVDEDFVSGAELIIDMLNAAQEARQ